MCSPLSNNFQTKWLQKVNKNFIKIVEAEYEYHSDKPFWESRPTRLYAIKPSPETIEIYQKEYNRLEKVFNSNYYQKECLENIFSDDEIILNLINEPRKLLPGIAFPAVNEYEADKNFPLVSFSRYDLRSIIDDTGTKELDVFINASQRLFEIVYNFTSIEYRKILIYFLPQLAFFQTINGDSYQLSLVMQIWYEWNKNSFQKYDMPSICATGCVTENGEILPIDKAEIKLEAAYSMGFDYIIFPEGNRKNLNNQLARFENKEKVLFFSHIKEAFEWLSLQTDKNRDIGIIKNWAEKQIYRQSSDTFASFFNTNDYDDPREWKKLIKGNADQKLDKLRVFLEEYCKWANIIPELKFDSLYNKYLDDFIKENDNSDLAEVLRFFRENIKTEGAAMQSTALEWVKKHNFSVEEASIVYYDKNISEKDQFILEFFRAFCFGEDINAIFQPVVWKSEKFRKLFTTLSIKVLSTNKELLKRYLIEIVSDVDNLILGFTALK